MIAPLAKVAALSPGKAREISQLRAATVAALERLVPLIEVDLGAAT